MLWSLALPTGYMFNMAPYSGVYTHLPETGLVQGPSVEHAKSLQDAHLSMITILPRLALLMK